MPPYKASEGVLAAKRQRHGTSHSSTNKEYNNDNSNNIPHSVAPATPHKTSTGGKHPELRDDRGLSSHAKRAANVPTPCGIKRTEKKRPSEYTAHVPHSWHLRPPRKLQISVLNYVDPLFPLLYLQTRRKSLSLDDGGVGGGVGDAARKVRRQRERVIRQRETDYWNTLGGVIREDTWQVILTLCGNALLRTG